MSKVTFEEDELAVVALFQENTRKDTIDILKDTLEALEETKEDPLESLKGYGQSLPALMCSHKAYIHQPRHRFHEDGRDNDLFLTQSRSI